MVMAEMWRMQSDQYAMQLLQMPSFQKLKVFRQVLEFQTTGVSR